MSSQQRQPSLSAEAKAWFREGRNDLANAILKALPDSMALGRETGSPGNPTQGELFQERTGQGPEIGNEVVELDLASSQDGPERNQSRGRSR